MPLRLFRPRRFAGHPASAVYGTIIVASQLAIESGTTDSTAAIIGSLFATAAVFWLAHAYTDSLGAVLDEDSGTTPSFRRALRAEWPIIESVAVPAVALLIAVGAGAEPSDAAVVAMIVAALELVGWTALAGRRADQHGWRLLAASLLSGLVGLALIGLKVLIH